MSVEVIIYDGATAYHYTMAPPAEQLLGELGREDWAEISIVEQPPEIRRGRPMRLTIRRTSEVRRRLAARAEAAGVPADVAAKIAAATAAFDDDDIRTTAIDKLVELWHAEPGSAGA